LKGWYGLPYRCESCQPTKSVTVWQSARGKLFGLTHWHSEWDDHLKWTERQFGISMSTFSAL
jgi:hypothetical protein